MSNKKTAVQWLQDKVEDHFCLLPVDLIEQAKAMEKEQMIEFADRYGFDVCHFDYDRADEYYEQTYGN